MEKMSVQVFLGVGGETKELQDYYTCYRQAIQALHVVSNCFDRGGVALFDELGVYTVLHYLKDSSVATLFIKSILDRYYMIQKGKTQICFKHCEYIFIIMGVLKIRLRSFIFIGVHFNIESRK